MRQYAQCATGEQVSTSPVGKVKGQDVLMCSPLLTVTWVYFVDQRKCKISEDDSSTYDLVSVLPGRYQRWAALVNPLVCFEWLRCVSWTPLGHIWPKTTRLNQMIFSEYKNMCKPEWTANNSNCDITTFDIVQMCWKHNLFICYLQHNNPLPWQKKHG